MRTIRFRGKQVDTGEWVYGFYTEYTCPEYGSIDYEMHTTDDVLDVDPNTAGQFTGLKDIYEGDVVELSNGTPYEVVYDTDYFGFFLKRHNNDLDEPEHIYGDEVNCFDLKVIGNVHEKK